VSICVREASTRIKRLSCAPDWVHSQKIGIVQRWTRTTITMPPKPTCKRGDVILALFPNSDLHTAKTRPALVVQADNLQTGIPQVIVAMITSRMFRAGHPSRMTVLRIDPEGRQSGLLTDSVVMTDNLATIVEVAVDRVIGTLPMNGVEAALRHTLAL
jgi:mRNA interferase MazF